MNCVWRHWRYLNKWCTLGIVQLFLCPSIQLMNSRRVSHSVIVGWRVQREWTDWIAGLGLDSCMGYFHTVLFDQADRYRESMDRLHNRRSWVRFLGYFYTAILNRLTGTKRADRLHSRRSWVRFLGYFHSVQFWTGW